LFIGLLQKFDKSSFFPIYHKAERRQVPETQSLKNPGRRSAPVRQRSFEADRKPK
jgi:hypothetical protein